MPNVSCKKCRANVSDEFSYCTNCGNRLDAEGRKASSETRQGAVVGAFVGFLYGIYDAILFYFITLPTILPIIAKVVASDPRFVSFSQQDLLSMVSTIMDIAAISLAPLSALFGCVLGIVFMKMRGHIPGSSIIRQSLVFSLVLFVISFILNLGNILDAIGSDSFPTQMGLSAFGLVVFVLLGWLFGQLLERRLKPKA